MDGHHSGSASDEPEPQGCSLFVHRPRVVESEQRVYRSCSRYAGVHVDIFQAEIAAKLLKQTSPLKAPARVQASAPTLSLKFCRDLQVPLCQAVCVRIIYALVIFIGPDHPANMILAILFTLRTTRPKACGLDKDFCACIK